MEYLPAPLCVHDVRFPSLMNSKLCRRAASESYVQRKVLGPDNCCSCKKYPQACCLERRGTIFPTSGAMRLFKVRRLCYLTTQKRWNSLVGWDLCSTTEQEKTLTSDLKTQGGCQSCLVDTHKVVTERHELHSCSRLPYVNGRYV